MKRYDALLTIRQWELITLSEERIVTTRKLWEELRALNDDFDEPYVGPESIHSSMRTLERRGLVMSNPGSWPTEWAATDEGLKARDLAEESCLAPS